jgi:hypothetical protein
MVRSGGDLDNAGGHVRYLRKPVGARFRVSANRVGFVMRLLRWFVSGLVACSAALLVPIVLSPTMVRAAALGPDEALKNLVGTTWMYGGLWTFGRPDPNDPATVRLRFPAEGKVEVVGPCGSEIGELRTAKSEAFGAPFQLVGVFASVSAAECTGSPRQGIVGDLIRSGIGGSTNPIQAMFRSKGHTFFEDTVTVVSLSLRWTGTWNF